MKHLLCLPTSHTLGKLMCACLALETRVVSSWSLEQLWAGHSLVLLSTSCLAKFSPSFFPHFSAACLSFSFPCFRNDSAGLMECYSLGCVVVRPGCVPCGPVFQWSLPKDFKKFFRTFSQETRHGVCPPRVPGSLACLLSDSFISLWLPADADQCFLCWPTLYQSPALAHFSS